MVEYTSLPYAGSRSNVWWRRLRCGSSTVNSSIESWGGRGGGWRGGRDDNPSTIFSQLPCIQISGESSICFIFQPIVTLLSLYFPFLLKGIWIFSCIMEKDVYHKIDVYSVSTSNYIDLSLRPPPPPQGCTWYTERRKIKREVGRCCDCGWGTGAK